MAGVTTLHKSGGFVKLFPDHPILPLQSLLTSKSNLLQQHESGLSSSSYELSQYMAAAPEEYEPMVSAAWRPIQAGGYQVATGAG